MAEIRPLRGWRYNQEKIASISSVISPLFDIVSAQEKECLYQNPYNSIHLSKPSKECSPEETTATLNEWKRKHILVQDRLPSLYVYYQYFTVKGATRLLCQKGFIAHVRICDWDEHVILRHENTMPHIVRSQEKLLEKTAFHASATHGLYTDIGCALEPWMDEAITNPLYEIDNPQGGINKLAVIQDKKIIELFVNVLRNKKIILADGHHRYQAAIDYRRQYLNEDTNQHDAGHHFHLMCFSNTVLNDLHIMPTHRLVQHINPFNEQAIVAKLSHFFIVERIDETANLIPCVDAGRNYTFSIVLQNAKYTVELKENLIDTIDLPLPDVVKRLNITVLHYFILEKILGIPYQEQRNSENIQFTSNVSEGLKSIAEKKFQMAIFTKGITIDDVKNVCLADHLMPQKSTYFYPKMICGLLFGSIQQDDFQTPPYLSFE